MATYYPVWSRILKSGSYLNETLVKTHPTDRAGLRVHNARTVARPRFHWSQHQHERYETYPHCHPTSCEAVAAIAHDTLIISHSSRHLSCFQMSVILTISSISVSLHLCLHHLA
ncbi:hypothetical protein J6590_081522 [Homalodisca vitripennis]|nr:hypothetical protein J6590_077326 [Homalodisca vitripennis]KAG8280468.1 hypothetical protein J6590_081522 [Homalodisca vitripennis]